jgi:hypothetical protein
MSSDRERQFGSYARDCVKAAELADTQELRERLLQMAREWMQACMEEEDNRNGLRDSGHPTRAQGKSTHSRRRDKAPEPQRLQRTYADRACR